MRNVPDWARLRRRYCAFWDGRVENETIIAHIQNPNPVQPAPQPWMSAASEAKYLDPQKLFDFKKWRCSAWNWHADLFQYNHTAYGPNVLAGFCGANVVFGPDTVWHEPIMSSLDEADKAFFDTDNRYWRAHLEAVEYFSRRCAGVEHIGMTDFGGPTDWISCLMGTENFLIATIEQPDKMRSFALRLARDCNRAFDIAYPMHVAASDGLVNWMPVWSDAPMVTVQDDMAINFSPEMYDRVFVPAIREMASHAQRTVLHWHDGCAHHVENLLKIDEIDLVQYGHDPNAGPYTKHLPNMRKIQQAGKRLLIGCVEARDAEFFIRNLDPRGLIMIIDTPDDASSAEMVERVAQWTQSRLAALQGASY